MSLSDLHLPIFPARPVNGGPIEVACAKHGRWYAEPKYNGWRLWVHVPSLKEYLNAGCHCGDEPLFNRHGQRLSISADFTEVLELLAGLPLVWLDCEALSRRHGLSKGSLILLDHFDPDKPRLTFEDRRAYLGMVCGLAKMKGRAIPIHDQLHVAPEPRSLYRVASYKDDSDVSGSIGPKLYEIVRQCNTRIRGQGKEDFYEGIVMKLAGSLYPAQLLDAERTTPAWIKHRWHF